MFAVWPLTIFLIRLLPCYVLQTKSGGRVSGLSKKLRRFSAEGGLSQGAAKNRGSNQWGRSGKAIPNEIRTWLIKGDSNTPFVVRHAEKGEIRIHSFPFSPSGSLSLLRIENRLLDRGPKALSALGLTAREAEVLYWISAHI